MSKAQHQGEAPVSLFEDLPAVDARQEQEARQARSAAERQGAARLLQPNRRQIELRASDLESLVGEDHLARLVWGYVERQDLSRLVEAIKARLLPIALDVLHRHREAGDRVVYVARRDPAPSNDDAA